MRRRLQSRRLHDQEDPDGSNNDRSVEENVSHSDISDCRECAQIADCVLQLQRKVLTSAVTEADWEANMQIIPITIDPNVRFSLSRRVKTERKSVADAGAENADMEEDYEYRREEAVMQEEKPNPKTNNQCRGLLQPEQEEDEAENGQVHGIESNTDHQTITRAGMQES